MNPRTRSLTVLAAGMAALTLWLTLGVFSADQGDRAASGIPSRVVFDALASPEGLAHAPSSPSLQKRFGLGASAHRSEGASADVQLTWRGQVLSWRSMMVLAATGDEIHSRNPGDIRISSEEQVLVQGAQVDGFLASVLRPSKTTGSQHQGQVQLVVDDGPEIRVVDGASGDPIPLASVELPLGDESGNPLLVTGALMLLPAPVGVGEFTIRAPGYQSRTVNLTADTGRELVELARVFPCQFAVDCDRTERRVVILSGRYELGDHIVGTDQSVVAASLAPGDYSAALEGRESSWDEWDRLDVVPFRVDALASMPILVELSEKRLEFEVACELRFLNEEAVRPLRVELLDSAGTRLATQEVRGEPNVGPQGVRLLTFTGVRTGLYRVLVIPDMLSSEVLVEAGYARTLTFDLTSGRTLQLFPVSAASGELVSDANAVLVLPDGAGRWPLSKGLRDGGLEVTTSANEVRVYLESPGYERWVRSLELDSVHNVVEAELEPAESTWLQLRVLRDGAPLVLSAEDLIEHLKVRDLDDTPVRFINIVGTGRVPGAYREPRFEFKYGGPVVVSLEAFGGNSAAEGSVTLSPAQTSRLDLTVLRGE